MGYSPLARLRRRLAAESGFSLIEAIVALSILALVSTSFSYGMNLALRVTRDDRLRQQATHLAERELEIVRNKFQHSDETGQLGVLQAGRVVNDSPLPGGTKGSPLQIDGRAFTVERTNSILLNGEGESACDGGATVDYLTIAVNVRVSWSDTGQEQAVESNTLLTPTKGVEGDVGYIAAKLTNSSGKGTGSVPVVATGPTGVSVTRYTAGDGCAVFMLSTAGDYKLKLNSAGYVNPDGFQMVEKPVTMQKGKLQVIPFSYEQSATLNATYVTAVGHQLPTPLPGLTLFNTGLPSGEMHSPPDASNPAALPGLWPFPDGYSIWAGTCDQSDPARKGLGSLRPVSLPVPADGSASAQVVLAPIAIRTIDGASLVGIGGMALVAKPADPTGCDTGELVLNLGTTTTDGYLYGSLPAGQWLIEPADPAVRCNPLDSCPEPTDTLVVVDEEGLAPDPLAVLTLPDMAVDL